MRVLVVGASGFIGKGVVKASREANFDVWSSGENIKESSNSKTINLFNKASVKKVLYDVRPDYIIDCAGTVKNTEKAYSINPVFTLNLLQSIIESEVIPKKIVFTGSASEYGVVGEKALPVNENTPFLAEGPYAKSKVLESSIALTFRESYNLPIVVAKIFNPIGVGMHPRFLIPAIVKQIEEIKNKKRKEIKISRLDSSRDYINITDVSEALVAICKKNANGPVYNIGSGQKTKNKAILDILLKEMKVGKKPQIRETENTPEPIYASQADITKIKKDTGWEPRISLQETIKEIVNGYKKN